MRVFESSENANGKNIVFAREEEGKIVCESKKLYLATSHSLEEILTVLASLGYDAVILDDALSKRYKEKYGESKEITSLIELINNVKSENSDECGAIGVFIGFVRKISGDKEVIRLEYEAYEPIFSEKIAEIEERLKEYPGVEAVKIHHKTGVLKSGEDIVYVVIMGRHRKDLWKPLEESMEIVKRELPVWKKEVYTDGEVWVHDVKGKTNRS